MARRRNSSRPSWWWLAGALAVWWCCAAAPAAGSVDCSTVTSLLVDCAAFVTHGAPAPAPGAPCCDGVAVLHGVALDSGENWQSVCRCLMGLISTYSSNASAIARLPGLCGVSLGFAIDPNADCRSIP